MGNINKRYILAAVSGVALLAALVGAVSLLYNCIELFSYTALDWVSAVKAQKLQAIVCAVATFFGFFGFAAGVASFFVKKQKSKIICFIICTVAAVALVACIIASNCLWLNWFKDKYKLKSKPFELPNSNATKMFAIFSAVMGMLIQELVYMAVIAAALIIDFVIAKKFDKTELKEDINQEQIADKENA